MPQIPLDQKFHTLDADTPTQERGSSLVNAGREIYTMQDIVDTAGGGGGSTTGEDLSLNVRSAPYSAAGDHEGTVLSIGTLGLIVGTVYMWDGSEWGAANAGALATADGLMGVATASAAAPDVLVSGIIQMSATGSAGDPLYLDSGGTNGLLTATAPGVGNIVRLMGYKLDSTRVYFNPSSDWIVT